MFPRRYRKRPGAYSGLPAGTASMPSVVISWFHLVFFGFSPELQRSCDDAFNAFLSPALGIRFAREAAFFVLVDRLRNRGKLVVVQSERAVIVVDRIIELLAQSPNRSSRKIRVRMRAVRAQNFLELQKRVVDFALPEKYGAESIYRIREVQHELQGFLVLLA